MTDHRCYVPGFRAGTTATLTGPEAHHLRDVLRAEVGTRVHLFDGVGHEGIGVVMAVSRQTIELKVESADVVSREAATRLVLASALPKGNREKFLVEKCMELGVAEFVALGTARGVVKPTSSFVRRAQRWVIETAKQCGRNELMEIRTASFTDFVSEDALPSNRFIADPDGQTLEKDHGLTELAIAVGPEGGWTEPERRRALANGWHSVSFGSRILRIETAGIAAAAYFLLGT